jgi:ABC-2 type transport system permease protein
MFWHNFKYAFKTLLKNRALVFWTLAFPFILAILFNVAFARLHDYDVFEPINVAVIDDDNYKNDVLFAQVFKTLGDGDNRVFNFRYESFDEAEKLLDDEKVDGIVYVEDEKPKIKIKQNGTNQTVLATVVEQITQKIYVVSEYTGSKVALATLSGQAVDIEAISREAVEVVTNSRANVRDESHVMNVVSIEFFTLIAMACMQGAMLSVELTNRCLPNISQRGKRVAIAPTRKGVMLSSSLLAGYVMLFGALMLLIAFMKFVLGVEFGGSILLIMLLSAVGALAAMMMGMFLSVTFKTNEAAKNVIVVIVTMVGCLFAGMFGGMKIFFDNMLPFINKVSPVGLITDGFYSLFYYEDSTRFIVNLLSLLAVGAVFFVLSIRSLRRARYDSI